LNYDRIDIPSGLEESSPEKQSSEGDYGEGDSSEEEEYDARLNMKI